MFSVPSVLKTLQLRYPSAILKNQKNTLEHTQNWELAEQAIINATQEKNLDYVYRNGRSRLLWS